MSWDHILGVRIPCFTQHIHHLVPLIFVWALHTWCLLLAGSANSYDTTTIRAATPMFLMSRKIKALGVKMVLSGEGASVAPRFLCHFTWLGSLAPPMYMCTRQRTWRR
jgi:hypothetical protein